jgi:uncharacterized damage-inducible protein DinB
VLTDASLGQAVGPEDRTIGRVAWHLTTTLPEMMGKTGLKVEGVAEDAPVPASAAAIADAYRAAAASLAAQVGRDWKDESLEIEDTMYGMQWKRGNTLSILVVHQAHHRGQLTVLMRQAGLKVPGVYGPAREEWSGMGVPAPGV